MEINKQEPQLNNLNNNVNTEKTALKSQDVEVFSSKDTNHDTAITKSELGNSIFSYRIKNFEVKDLASRFNNTGSSTLTKYVNTINNTMKSTYDSIISTFKGIKYDTGIARDKSEEQMIRRTIDTAIESKAITINEEYNQQTNAKISQILNLAESEIIAKLEQQQVENNRIINNNSKISEEEIAQQVLKQDGEGIYKITRSDLIQPSANIMHVQEVKCESSPEYVTNFKNTVNQAKNIIIQHSKELGLDETSINFIKNATFESIPNGPSRYSPSDNQILFNINSENKFPQELLSLTSVVRLLLHECNHATIRNGSDMEDTKSEEAECESKAVMKTCELIQKGYINDDIAFLPNNGKPKYFSDIYKTGEINNNTINNFVTEWINENPYYSKLK